jgi:hypothetical protein
MTRDPLTEKLEPYASSYPGVDHHPNQHDHPRYHRHFHDCARCGQVVITRAAVPMCETCQKLARAPQGEPMRLFTPAPTQLAGQLTL